MILQSRTLCVAAASVGLFAARNVWADSGIDSSVTDIEQVPIEALINTPTTVASTKATRLRESPGVLTVLTKLDLERLGVRDLTDVLHMVPGFEMGTDVSGGIGAAFRGVWAHEGKVLLLWDGFEFNELLYFTLFFGNHFPMADIERIEIIRGPGSAVYGGAAELAVINVVTTSGAQRHSIGAYGSFGTTKKEIARTTGGLTYGQGFKGALEGLELTADIYGGKSLRSGRRYTDVYGTSYQMKDGAELDPLMVSLGAHYAGLEVRAMFDGFHTRTQDGYDAVPEQPYDIDFPSWYVSTKYQLQLGENLTITPKIDAKRQIPWRSLGENTPAYLNWVATRLRGSVVASWDVLPELNLLAGTEAFVDDVQEGKEGVAETLLKANKNDYGDGDSFKNVAVYGQGMLRSEYGNATLGARAEKHSAYGTSFVPRFVYTKVFDRFHFKALASGAFKAPAVQNIVASPDVNPERARVFEAEFGAQITDSAYITMNGYDVTIDNPIIYVYSCPDPDAACIDTFVNYEKTGSRGVELEAVYQLGSVHAGASYSFYTSKDKNSVDIYQVPGNDSVNIGFPAHKVTGNVTVDVTEKLASTVSMVYRSKRYGETSVDEDGNPTFKALSPTLLVNANVHYTDLLGIAGLSGRVGVYNLLSSRYKVPQGYWGDHAPLPAEPFELLVDLTYRFGL